MTPMVARGVPGGRVQAQVRERCARIVGLPTSLFDLSRLHSGIVTGALESLGSCTNRLGITG